MSTDTKDETINLIDFLKEAIVAFKGDPSDLDEDTRTHRECSECGKYYEEGEDFCSVDGKDVIMKTSSFYSEDTRDFMYDILNDLSRECPESFPYTYVTSVEKRGDSSGYYQHFIFQRKSDLKYFVYCSYDGRIEDYDMDECEKVVTTSWDFERRFD